jgi:predicted metal-binding membrane protein
VQPALLGRPAGRSRGQALVELALVTPILLLLIIGSLALGALVLQRIQMQHAANETAVAVAQHPSGCSVAGARVGQLLGFAPSSVACSSGGQMITVSLAHAFPVIAPLVPTYVEVSGRAIIRSEPTEETVVDLVEEP